jgi:hypothetical protein
MKRADSTYQPGRRCKSWLKSVLRGRAAVVLAGWIPGAAESVGSLIVGAHNTSGDLVCCGVISSGLNCKSRTTLHARLSEIQTARAPFRDMPPSAAVGWVHPRLVAMIEYREFNGRFRHPAFKGLLRADPTIVPLPNAWSSGCIFTSVFPVQTAYLRCCPTRRERGDIASAPRGSQAAVGDVGEGNPRAIRRKAGISAEPARTRCSARTGLDMCEISTGR